MAAAMALMESPAIIMAVVLANSLRQNTATQIVTTGSGVAALSDLTSKRDISLGKILHESFTDGAQLLLLGAMLVSMITSDI